MFPFTHGIIASSSGGAVAPSTDFIIRVKTDNAGTSASNQFTIPTVGVGYNYNITTDEHNLTNQTGSVTLTFSTAGEYDVRISGSFPTIYFNNGGDKLKLIYTYNFGDVGWNTLVNSFRGCTNNEIDLGATGNFTNVTNIGSAWRNNNLTSFPLLSFPNVTSSIYTWGENNLNSFPAIDLPNCSNILDCWTDNNLTSFPLIDLSSVTIAERAWKNNNLTSFSSIDMPLCLNIREAWDNNNLDTFPAINLSSATNLLAAWRNNGVISSFATRNFYSMSIGNSAFNGTTLPTTDYSDILITQNANNANTGVNFHGGSSNYNASATSARTNLVSVKSWTITDAGLV